jgi:hypothetical protein
MVRNRVLNHVTQGQGSGRPAVNAMAEPCSRQRACVAKALMCERNVSDVIRPLHGSPRLSGYRRSVPPVSAWGYFARGTGSWRRAAG